MKIVVGRISHALELAWLCDCVLLFTTSVQWNHIIILQLAIGRVFTPKANKQTSKNKQQTVCIKFPTPGSWMLTIYLETTEDCWTWMYELKKQHLRVMTRKNVWWWMWKFKKKFKKIIRDHQVRMI